MSVPLADLPVQWWLQLQGLQREFSLVSAQNRGSKPFLRLSFNSLAFGTPSFSAPGRTICSVPPLVLTLKNLSFFQNRRKMQFTL